MYKASVVVSFYNKINELKLVLAGLERQTATNFEVIIADDGSGEEAIAELKKTIESSPLPVQHLWHEDKGFRKTRILNKAIVKSHSEYLIFLDGDCIPHYRFVEEHITNSQKGMALTGRRVNLPKRISDSLDPNKVRKGSLEKFYLLKVLKELFYSDERRRQLENGFYVRSRYLRKFINNKKKGILGSNFSAYKEDLYKVNGFDERYNYPACGEDTDIEMRLRRAGMKVRNLKHIAIQFHLFHKQLPRDERRLEVYSYNLEKNIVFTPFGINQTQSQTGENL